MAEPRRAARAAGSLPRLLPLAAAMLATTPLSHAQGQWDVMPRVSLYERYSDNVGLRRDDEARSQWVTELRPSVAVTGKSRRLNVAAFASWQQYYYSDKDEVRSPVDSRQTYSANLQGTLVDQMMYVDARASKSNQNIVAFGPGALDNPYSRENQTDVKTWSISPYLVRRIGRDASMQLRYTRDSVDGGLRSTYGSTTGDTVLLNLASGAQLRTLGWGLTYVRQDIDNRLLGESSSEVVTGSLRHQFSRSWAATATAGHDTYDFEGPGPETKGHNWSVGGVWTPSTRTSIQASAGRHLYGKTGALNATVRSRRTVWDVQYSDAITSSRSRFLLPAAVDTAALLDNLFSSIFPDALARERAVAAYIQANGLPSSIASDITFLSNRYAREKLLRGSFAWRSPRATTIMSVYRTERRAISDQQSDNPLLGTSMSSLNNNVRQHGASLNVNYRFSPRTNLNTGADYRFSESLTTGIESRQRTMYARLHRDLGRYLQGSLEVRRRTGGTDFAGRRDYTENAVLANLTMTY